jgi:hypothetical protein
MITAIVLALGAATACGQAPGPLTGPAATPSRSADSPNPDISPIAAASPSPAQSISINVTGVVDRGQPAPCPPGDPCDPPATASYLVFSQPGRADVRVGVDGKGAFALYLAPGSYSISAAPPPMQGSLSPSTVRVPASGTITLRLVIR